MGRPFDLYGYYGRKDKNEIFIYHEKRFSHPSKKERKTARAGAQPCAGQDPLFQEEGDKKGFYRGCKPTVLTVG